MCTLDWDEVNVTDVPIERLRQAEATLRAKAFPLATAAAA